MFADVYRKLRSNFDCIILAYFCTADYFGIACIHPNLGDIRWHNSRICDCGTTGLQLTSKCFVLHCDKSVIKSTYIN